MHLTDAQLRKLKETKIFFSYKDSTNQWIDEGIISVPTRDVYAEDYASYFRRTEFYSIGAFSYSWTPFSDFVSIGRYTSISMDVEIMPKAHPTDLFTTSSMIYDPYLLHRRAYYADEGHNNDDVISRWHPTNEMDIIIGNDVYIGFAAKLRRGIKIGNGAIVGAYSVVTKDVAPYSVVVGNPARVVRMRYAEDQIAALNEIEWWNYDFQRVLNEAHISEIDVFIDRMKEFIAAGTIKPFSPRKNYLMELLA